jgi:two-component system, OmpR family, response regulator ChvI
MDIKLGRGRISLTLYPKVNKIQDIPHREHRGHLFSRKPYVDKTHNNAREESSTPMLKQESNKSKSKTKGKILIVDDEPDITESFGLALEDSGFEVDKYNDPAVALASFKPTVYGLLILDIKMPKMDGFELYDKLKKIDKKVNVFFVSAFEVDREALSKQYSGLNIENFLSKPIHIPELIKRVEEQIWQMM